MFEVVDGWLLFTMVQKRVLPFGGGAWLAEGKGIGMRRSELKIKGKKKGRSLVCIVARKMGAN